MHVLSVKTLYEKTSNVELIVNIFSPLFSLDDSLCLSSQTSIVAGFCFVFTFVHTN